MQRRPLKIVALAVAVVLSIACGFDSESEASLIAEDIARKGKRRTKTWGIDVRVIALGLALGMTVACGTSGLESYQILSELAAKGDVAAKEADDMLKHDRPEAAIVILRRHLREVDDAIAKVKKDDLINERDKTKLLEALDDYEKMFEKSTKRVRALINLESDLGRR